jgi:hypothetical protein
MGAPRVPWQFPKILDLRSPITAISEAGSTSVMDYRVELTLGRKVSQLEILRVNQASTFPGQATLTSP